MKKKEAHISEILLSFVGDIMAHDVNFKMKNYALIYDDVRDILTSDDISFANIETPICENMPLSTYPCFNVHKNYLQAAIEGGFDVFSFANNHTNDLDVKGIDGTLSSFSYLKNEYKKNKSKENFSSGLKEKVGEDFAPILITKKDWKILFLSITEILNSYGKSKDRVYYSAPTKEGREKLISAIKNMREKNFCDLFILSLHLAEPEYGLKVLKEKKEWFTLLSKAGVDILWAHHPHVLQPWEKVNIEIDNNDKNYIEEKSNINAFNKYRPIIKSKKKKNAFFMYSMGNFISGQRWRVNYENPAYYREYTGDSAIIQLRLKKIDGVLQENMEVMPILITNYNTAEAPVVKRFTSSWIETLNEKEKKYYLKRLELMKEYLPPLEKY